MDKIFVFTDGGARGNPGPAAAGVIIKDHHGRNLVSISKYLGRATNNVAEYMAVIEGLEWIRKNLQFIRLPAGQAVYNLQFFLDSKLVVNQLNGYYKIKDAKLRSLIIKVRILEREIKGKIHYHLVPREKNILADSLVNKVLDLGSS